MEGNQEIGLIETLLMKNWKRIIGYIFTSLMVILGVIYLITDSKWAQMTWALSLCIVSLYNLFFNPVNRNKSKDED